MCVGPLSFRIYCIFSFPTAISISSEGCLSFFFVFGLPTALTPYMLSLSPHHISRFAFFSLISLVCQPSFCIELLCVDNETLALSLLRFPKKLTPKPT
jgi:hypothetical protein